MSIVVETGDVIENANSYVTRADYIAYASSLGTTIADAEAADQQLISACNFISDHEDNIIGLRVSKDQFLAFPRIMSDPIDGFYWESDEIPRNVKSCQMALALEINAGVDLYNRTPNKFAKKEKVEGAVEVEYFGSENAVKLSKDSRGLALLRSFLRKSGLMSIALERA
jgi:hypothetical protein